MTNPKLIQAVAKRLGWTEIELSTDHEGCPIIQGKLNGIRVESQPWDESIDAALGVLENAGLEYDISLRRSFKEHPYAVLVWGYRRKTITTVGAKSKSLPRAILEAFLQSSKEKS